MFDQLFDYLREHPGVLGGGFAGALIFGFLIIFLLDWRYGILDDPKPQQFKKDN